MVPRFALSVASKEGLGVGIADTHVKSALTGEEEEFGAVQELFVHVLLRNFAT